MSDPLWWHIKMFKYDQGMYNLQAPSYHVNIRGYMVVEWMNQGSIFQTAHSTTFMSPDFLARIFRASCNNL